MKKSFFYCAALLMAGSVMAVSCKETPVPLDFVDFDPTVVQEAPSFTDERDGHTYACVKIGDQIWMAENLAYAPSTYSFDGCYTWMEAPAEFDLKFVPDSVISTYNDLVTMGMCIDLLDVVAAQNAFKDNEEIANTITWCKPPYMELEWLPMMGINSIEDLMEFWFGDFPDFGVAMLAARDAQVRKEISKDTTILLTFTEMIGEGHFKEAEDLNGGYVKDYGHLYTLEGAQKAVPAGWRLPTDEDWKKLEIALGMQLEECEKMEDWRGATLATLLSERGESGFNAKRGGGAVYMAIDDRGGERFQNKGKSWYYWTNTQFKENDSIPVAIYRMSAQQTDKVWRGTTRLTNGYQPMLYHVRCVK